MSKEKSVLTVMTPHDDLPVKKRAAIENLSVSYPPVLVAIVHVNMYSYEVIPADNPCHLLIFTLRAALQMDQYLVLPTVL